MLTVNDSTFLRNLARRGRVVLLADGTAVPAPVSVMDDESLAGAAFRINLVSPEEIESGDRRTFRAGTVEHRELPIPLMWQWQLDDGHKTAVVVGRIDHIERVDDGLGNAYGVFDLGQWGREAERMVRAGMLRGVSGDYSNFDAQVLEKVEDTDNRLLDDKVSVQKSKLVAATIVAKPAFEGCWIEIVDETPAETVNPDEYEYPDGVNEAQAPITAASLIAGGRSDLVQRLERLEWLEAVYEAESLALTASAARERVETHRLQYERETAIARIRSARNLTAAWQPMDKAFLSAKAKLQPRDSKGRWIDMGASVRWLHGTQIGGNKPSGADSRLRSYNQGKVTGFDPKSKLYTIEPNGGGEPVKLEGKNLEVIKAVIPDKPGDVKKPGLFGRNAPTDRAGQKLKVGDAVTRENPSQGGKITSLVDSDGKVGFTVHGYDPAKDEQRVDPSDILKNSKDADLIKKSEREQRSQNEDADLLKQAEGWSIPELESELINRSENHLPDPGLQDILDRKMAVARGNPEMNRKDDEAFARQAREQELSKPPARTADDDWEPDPTPGDGGDKPSGDQPPAPAGGKPEDPRPETKKTTPAPGLENVTRGDELRFSQNPLPGEDIDVKYDTGLVHEVKDGRAWVTFGDAGGWVPLDDPGTTVDGHFDFNEPDVSGITPAPGLENVKRGDELRFSQNPIPGEDIDVKYDTGLVHKVEDGRAWVTFGDVGGWVNLDDPGTTVDGHFDFGDDASSPRKAIQDRAGLTDEEMTGAPELLPATEDLRKLVETEDFLSPKDLADFHDYLDEVQIAPGARGPEQWDSIDAFIKDRKDSLNDDQFSQLEDAVAKARKESLDSPGEDTIESLDSPAGSRPAGSNVPAGNDAPAGNITEFAKNMFNNLHPDSNWDEADQTAWLDAAKKAMEKPND